MGPFVDAQHPRIESATLDNDETFDQLFDTKVTSQLNELSCKVIIIPSTRDINHDFVFPQCPLIKKNEISENVRFKVSFVK
jgi:DNA polymerase alpha subunit B